jgi:hypothetical protein
MQASLTARQNLEQVLAELYPQAQPLMEGVAGGFVVALVAPEFTTKPTRSEEIRRLFLRLGQINESIPDMANRVAVFSLRFAPDERALFTENCALRTRRNEWSQNGVLTHYASEGDGNVLAHCLDAEAILIDPRAKAFCRVVQNPQFKNCPVGLGRYVQFDLAGHTFEVRELSREGDTDVWRVFLG